MALREDWWAWSLKAKPSLSHVSFIHDSVVLTKSLDLMSCLICRRKVGSYFSLRQNTGEHYYPLEDSQQGLGQTATQLTGHLPGTISSMHSAEHGAHL